MEMKLFGSTLSFRYVYDSVSIVAFLYSLFAHFFFDNLSVKTYSGPMVEENHYYPFGLTMTGISDKALRANYAENKLSYNGKELQHQEFSDGSGLEEYDYGSRFYNAQIGRFDQIDPKAGKYSSESTYDYVGNNPISRFDPNGKEWDDKAKKEVADLNNKIDSKIGEIGKQIGKVSKSGKDDNGNSIYNEDEQAQVDELNSKKDNLSEVKNEIQQMGEDKDHIFSLEGKRGK